jgi:high-affinity K+ transport system ATPase subunit B
VASVLLPVGGCAETALAEVVLLSSLADETPKGRSIVPDDLGSIVEHIAMSGSTPLVVAEGDRILGVIHLKDTGTWWP